MVESVDTRDLKSLGHCGCAGSSPASSTKTLVSHSLARVFVFHASRCSYDDTSFYAVNGIYNFIFAFSGGLNLSSCQIVVPMVPAEVSSPCSSSLGKYDNAPLLYLSY